VIQVPVPVPREEHFTRQVHSTQHHHSVSRPQVLPTQNVGGYQTATAAAGGYSTGYPAAAGGYSTGYPAAAGGYSTGYPGYSTGYPAAGGYSTGGYSAVQSRVPGTY
jgi:hypothetical protein